jgi:hypothetical protein
MNYSSHKMLTERVSRNQPVKELIPCGLGPPFTSHPCSTIPLDATRKKTCLGRPLQSDPTVLQNVLKRRGIGVFLNWARECDSPGAPSSSGAPRPSPPAAASPGSGRHDLPRCRLLAFLTPQTVRRRSIAARFCLLGWGDRLQASSPAEWGW